METWEDIFERGAASEATVEEIVRTLSERRDGDR
jgi:hypothetical protein